MPRATYTCTLEPLEVVVVYLPIVATPPTPIEQVYPLRVQCQPHSLPTAQIIRLPTPERPPYSLRVSPVHVADLREVQFQAHSPQDNMLVSSVEIIPGAPTQKLDPGQPSHRSLWGVTELKAKWGERLIARAMEALRQLT